jgi:hypothetical protein
VPFRVNSGSNSGTFAPCKGASLGTKKAQDLPGSNSLRVHNWRRFNSMLTKIDIENIRSLKEKGYSRRRVAIELGFNPKTIGRYWGESAISRRLEDYFSWGCCDSCGIEYPKPKFLATWHCPGCRKQVSWVESWYLPSNHARKN